MIRPVTFQGKKNFRANLYALEIKSRFIDQNNAHGYYKGYGAQLAAQVIGSNIVIGSGALLVCGRLSDIYSDESVAVNYEAGKVGYIVARLETYHPGDEFNCRLLCKTAATLAAIPLTQEDTYSDESNTINKIFELPLYSFSMTGGSITNLTFLLSAIDDYAKVKAIVDAANATAAAANATAAAANSTANAANATAGQANATANAANATAADAKTIAQGIDGKAQQALDTSNAAVASIATYKTEINNTVAELEQQIGEKQGTTIKSDGEPIALLDLDSDTINYDGGNA